MVVLSRGLRIVKCKRIQENMIWVVSTRRTRKDEIAIEVKINFEREAEVERLG
jgi:hypothetical protein